MPKNKPTGDINVPLSQVNYIIEAFGNEVETEPPGWATGKNPRPVKFLYRKNHLLIRDQDVPRLRDAGVSGKVVSHPVPGLALVSVAQSGTKPTENLLTVLGRINKVLGPRVATPDHLMHICPPSDPGTHCPATEPDSVPGDARPRPAVFRDGHRGSGVLVAVVDTGLLESAPALHPWLRGVTGDFEPEVDPTTGLIPRYTAHGTFIASIVRAMAPGAEVRVGRIFERAGARFESEVVQALYQMMDSSPPDIISLSAGTHTWLNGGLLSFRFFIDGPLRQHRDTVLVAAAGNDGRNWKFSPAKMKGVISVGALAPNGKKRAWFSNFGNWVRVYAPGQNLVHAYSRGTYHYYEHRRPDETFDGMARWSGTSFSTPLVSGLIAARMSETGETAREAARELLLVADAHARPGVGPVLRPS